MEAASVHSAVAFMATVHVAASITTTITAAVTVRFGQR
jgi:hypothetical protein